MSLLLGFTGKAMSGKDTAANAIEEYCFKELFLDGVFKVAFAYKLKTLCADLFNVPPDYFWSKKHEFDERLGVTYRDLLQLVGTKMRDIYEPVWTEACMRKIDQLLQVNMEVILVTDVRFIEEAKAIKDRGGYLIKLIKQDGKQLQGQQAQHASETEQDSPEFQRLVDKVIIAKQGEVDYIKKEAINYVQYRIDLAHLNDMEESK